MSPGSSTIEPVRPARERSVPLPSAEQAVLAILGLNLLLEPWLLGAMHVASQLIALVLSALALISALALPRLDLDRIERPAQRLLRFPLFWCGLALLFYICLQALNPSWRYSADAETWRLDPLAHNPSLPSGVEAPFARSNPLRAAVILAAPWLAVCAAWCGFSRRASYSRLFILVAINGALVAGLGLAQRLAGSERIFWTYRPANDAQFMATFIYRNHAGAYLALAFAISLGLSAWHGRRWRRQLEGPGLTVLSGFVSAVAAIGVVFSDSRAAIVLLALPLLALSLDVLLKPGASNRRGWLRAFWPLLGLMGVALLVLGSGDVRRRFAALLENPAETLDSRRQAREAATEMLEDRWTLGWGAGCFRYGFPLYAQKYPQIYYAANHRIKYWEHVHDDWIEYPLELGAVGMIPIVVSMAFLVWRIGRSRAVRSPFCLCAAAGCAATLAHGWVDFVFQNPAILGLWSVLIVGTLRWAELEASVGRRRLGPRERVTDLEGAAGVGP